MENYFVITSDTFDVTNSKIYDDSTLAVNLFFKTAESAEDYAKSIVEEYVSDDEATTEVPSEDIKKFITTLGLDEEDTEGYYCVTYKYQEDGKEFVVGYRVEVIDEAD